MKYEAMYDNYADALIVKLLDGRQVLLNITMKEACVGECDDFRKNGMWEECTNADISKENHRLIEEILKNTLGDG